MSFRSSVKIGMLATMWSGVLHGAIPDVQEEKKSSPTSLLTLREVYVWGKKNYTDASKKAVENLAANKDLQMELAQQAKLSKNLSQLSLTRICAIESQCSLDFAFSKPAYKGFFQMGALACEDVGVDFTKIDEPAEWRAGCDAGRKFLDLKWQELVKAGATLSDGDKNTLTLIYLAHQLGGKGGQNLFKMLDSGKSGTEAATKDMKANVPKKATAAITGDGKHGMTQLEFYAYWVGSIDAVLEQFPSK